MLFRSAKQLLGNTAQLAEGSRGRGGGCPGEREDETGGRWPRVGIVVLGKRPLGLFSELHIKHAQYAFSPNPARYKDQDLSIFLFVCLRST